MYIQSLNAMIAGLSSIAAVGAANAWQFNNDITVPYDIGCELEKKRVECALWIKSQEI